MSAVSFRSAVATGLVAKPAARDVKARAGLKVYARMTKDRVSLKKDSKWRSDIDIYPVRPGGAARPVSLCLVTRGGTERARHTPPRRSRPQPRRTPRAPCAVSHETSAAFLSRTSTRFEAIRCHFRSARRCTRGRW